MILSGRTVTVNFADGRRETITVTNSDELRFEQQERISLSKIIVDDAVPLWVIAGIIHWRLLKSDLPDIPASLDDFMDLLDPVDWLDVGEEGKAEASDSTPPTG